MSRYLGPKCRLCRREGKKLFLKGQRCNSPQCPLDKKGAVTPGFHKLKRRSKLSSYGEQLREKQKLKRIYGVLERPLRNYYLEAKRSPGATGKILLKLLELRLDNVVYRLGLAPSRIAARQFVSHGGIEVNGKKVNIASFRVRKGDIITIHPKMADSSMVKKILSQKDYLPPAWIERKSGVGRILAIPGEEDLTPDINDKLIIEFYSR